ncbi:M56 family metallopeptidase [Paenibacillus eucommiae]|uniref:Beta-lactamase regulating signal transducer with metallopeptidase domain n=1 Tax=Paenibacillus eucommiae TaxID=1355755 RepID=A0ABS4INY9_9BACL|nr:M56 family metallopeptidase [Paenibacillus eucommiae]MBP1988885.1 beta-lactamase regulating signal transducer with metallopeptidase domain [Paenibacillus eucommiae]
MQGFLTNLLQSSVSMSLITLVYAAILPLLSKRYAAKWNYMVWLLVAAGWVFPFRPRIDLLFLPVQMRDIPLTQSIINDMPFMDVGDNVSTRATIPFWWVLAVIWGLGFVSIVLYHVLRHGRFMKMVRRWSEPVTDLKVLGILDNLSSELGIKKHIGISVCESVSSPMLVGLFRPVILLPPFKISIDELSLILKHELIHFKRHDLWYKAMILTATAFHWFNPVVYLMAKAAAEQCEISCDSLVLQNADFHQRIQYGESIIGVVRNGAKLQTAISTNFYGGKKGMKNRISSIMDLKRKKAGVLILCMALIGILLTGTALASTNTDQESITTVVSGTNNSDSNISNEVIRLKESLRNLYID